MRKTYACSSQTKFQHGGEGEHKVPAIAEELLKFKAPGEGELAFFTDMRLAGVTPPSDGNAPTSIGNIYGI